MNLKIDRYYLPVLLLPLLFWSADSKGQNAPLDKYISEGVNNNLAFREKNIDTKKALYAIRSAESAFLPTVSLSGSYQTGSGGRNISLPIGDLMNPVYTTLNQLIGSTKFPSVDNVKQNFLPNNFYDVKIRTSLPIINTDLKYDIKIQRQQSRLQDMEVEELRLRLVRNITVSYYTYCSALQAVRIYESSLLLANENLRRNERLLEGGKGLPSYILRSRSEQEIIKAKIAEARTSVKNSQLYFNFLLNRNSEDSIEVAASLDEEFSHAVSLLSEEIDISNRPAIRLSKELIRLQNTLKAKAEKYRLPKLDAVLDLGSQSQEFKFNTTTTYYYVGIQLDVPLFSGKRNLYRIRQAELDEYKAVINHTNVSQQVNLSAESGRNYLLSAYQDYNSALKNAEYAASYERLIQKGFKEGVNTFLEDIDARNLSTSAQLQLNISFYKVLIAAAELQGEAGLLKLKQ
jgi:outer membrane protein TolC